jgi:hypothetical protein
MSDEQRPTPSRQKPEVQPKKIAVKTEGQAPR